MLFFCRTCKNETFWESIFPVWHEFLSLRDFVYAEIFDATNCWVICIFFSPKCKMGLHLLRRAFKLHQNSAGLPEKNFWVGAKFSNCCFLDFPRLHGEIQKLHVASNLNVQQVDNVYFTSKINFPNAGWMTLTIFFRRNQNRRSDWPTFFCWLVPKRGRQMGIFTLKTEKDRKEKRDLA